MAARDYSTAPVSEQLGLPQIIAGLVGDLEELRAGKITVNDAMARSMLAKQIFNGVRLYLNGTKLLYDNARAASPCILPDTPASGTQTPSGGEVGGKS